MRWDICKNRIYCERHFSLERQFEYRDKNIGIFFFAFLVCFYNNKLHINYFFQWKTPRSYFIGERQFCFDVQKILYTLCVIFFETGKILACIGWYLKTIMWFFFLYKFVLFSERVIISRGLELGRSRAEAGKDVKKFRSR